MSLALAMVSCVLLALVAGLLLLLGQLLRGMRKELREAPLLAEKLAQQLLAVRSGLEQARHDIFQAAQRLGPDFGSQVQAAQTLLGDLKFLTARAEQMATKLENGVSKGRGNGKVEASVSIIEEKTVQVEAPIAAVPNTHFGADPLESLLADLGDAAGGGRQVSRRPSQAEAELRAKNRH